jgi:hypothetical protein
MAFGLLQIGHLGIAMALVNYGASSAARKAVEQNDPTGANAAQQFSSLIAGTVGLKSPSVRCSSDGATPAPNITVTACAELPAYPFVGPFLDQALKTRVSDGSCAAGARAFGPVALKGPPYMFIIEGKAIARMNYKS